MRLFFISLSLLVAPCRVGVGSKVRVVVSLYACYLVAKPLGAHKFLVGRLKLHLGNSKPEVIAQELIYLEGVPLELDKVAMLLYDATLGKLHKLQCLTQANLLLPLKAAQSTIFRRPLNREPGLVVGNAHTHRATSRGNVSLHEVYRAVDMWFVVAHNSEFSFYLQHDYKAKRRE